MAGLPTAFNLNKILAVPGPAGPPGAAGPTGPAGSGSQPYVLSDNVVAGDWLAVDTTISGGTHAKRATPTTVRLAGGVLGCVDASHSIGDTVTPKGPGSIVAASAFSDLGSGTVSDLILNSLGRAIRSIITGGEIRLGSTDGSGNVFIFPTVTALTAATQVYTLEQFGAIGDGIHDDTPAWVALMNAIPNAVNIPAQVHLGMKMYKMAGESDGKIHVRRPIHLVGHGGGASPYPVSGFKFAPLGGLVIDSSNTSSDGGSGASSCLEWFDVQAKTDIAMNPTFGGLYSGLTCGVDIRVAGTYVEKGTLVLYSGATAVAGGGGSGPTVPGTGSHVDVGFRCMTAGTPTGSEPASFATATTANIGNTITDTGGVTWKVESIPKDRQNSTAYVVGQRILIPGDNRGYYECTVGGTSDNNTNFQANGSFVQKFPNTTDTFTDGGVTWKLVCAANIYSLGESVKIHHTNHFGGLGYGVHYDSGYVGPGSTNYVFSDFCDVVDAQFFYTGGGVHYHGSDANGGYTRTVRYFGQTTWQRTKTTGTAGTGEICIWDRGLGGQLHVAPYSQFSEAPSFAADYASGATPGTISTSAGPSAMFIHYLGESLASIGIDATFIGDDAAGLYSNAFGQHIGSTSANVKFAAAGGGSGTLAIANTYYNKDAVWGFQGSGDAGFTAWWDQQINGTPISTGKFVLAYGPFVGNIPPRAYMSVSQFGSRNTAGGSGPGFLLGIYDGYLTGRSQDKYYAFDDAMLTNPGLRYGARSVGDSFPWTSATHAKGTWRRIVTSTAGARGVKWTAGLVYQVEASTPYYSEATVVEPSTSNVLFSNGTSRAWKFNGGPGNTGVEPIWPSSGNFTDAAGNAWIDVGVTPVFGASDFIDDPVTAMTPQTQLAWHDTAATDSVTAAPNKYTLSYRAQIQTTASTANQTLFIIPDFKDNSINSVSVVIEGKRNGNHSSYVVAKAFGSRGRNNGGAPEDGTDSLPTPDYLGSENALNGVLFDLHDSGNGALVRVTNLNTLVAGTMTIDWGITVQVDGRQSP